MIPRTDGAAPRRGAGADSCVTRRAHGSDSDALRDAYGSTRDDLRAAAQDEALDGSRRERPCELHAPALRAGRFALAVVGEFSSGKSFLLNALLGNLRYGKRRRRRASLGGLLAPTSIPRRRRSRNSNTARTEKRTLYYEDGATRARAARSLSTASSRSAAGDAGTMHDGRRARRLGAGRWCVKTDSPFLHSGYVVADTPGLASLNPAHRRATLRYLPTGRRGSLSDRYAAAVQRRRRLLLEFGTTRGTLVIFIVQTKIDLWRSRKRGHERLGARARTHRRDGRRARPRNLRHTRCRRESTSKARCTATKSGSLRAAFRNFWRRSTPR